MSTELDRIEKKIREDYRRDLERIISSDAKGEITNRYPWQIRMVIEALLKLGAAGKHTIRLLSGGFSELYNNNLIARLQRCLENGCNIQIIFWRDDSGKEIPEELLALSQRYKQLLEIKTQPKNHSAYPPLSHVLLVGDKHYRREAVHGDISGENFSDKHPEIFAEIYFNNPDRQKPISAYFKSVWAVCDVAA